MIYKTQGIIIKKTDLTEADRLLTIYTKDLGKILVKARAVKKTQAKLKGHLELFLHSHLMLAQGRNMDIITSAETIEGFPNLHQDLSALASAYYLAELIDKLIAGQEKDQRIWDLILSSFQQLNIDVGIFDVGRLASHIQIFENKLLEFLGYDLSGQSSSKDPLSFIQSLIGEKINSGDFLKKTAFMIK
ncbi:MAG: DNA repair protein RecO [Candidatus Portnoybacteria bacterium RIFCSPLOWO2_01_FULL_43_11]|uniref:DNA repair protein RecO n=4 Tax=Candidatus Portnoyibacteriota TaxID=1817913 RepID=A0A1G2FE80_9BACT|nr:MAG: DNA repair protein RecO [Candidatus Portnoybacteria bacterium RIFCSPHIGHO2_01_FULL_40_12b]OGZ36339.1 MAG: DNA repair protein RecO [Candidatus Portnoybacteria bacterium RIFCSPHIGHO2_02_FULL_40_23]OGZ38454.1 MAG: DNA repair protein RecO [Candidatus Portnoybacteria bacterium RIFCSPHIGHO2_12_FULL_40_11]OGZ38763.1 MAG: DNA repair protein RecO [Candidatus Portnoybacteria bacterium RIFCSPLOWO2_01_FULL_43_11]OGZ40307.1 MAG: DNA repair protein RecO [Candidatus Portnoybacteria bacterium RIFCSPLOW